MTAFGHFAEATHIRAGEITVTRPNCLTRDFVITIRAFTDTGGASPPVQFGDGLLDFGDGSEPMFISINDVRRMDVSGFANTVLNIVTVTHTFRGSDEFKISYKESNRNDDILNITNSVDTPFYIETKITTDNFFGCNNSPQLNVAPLDEGCTTVAFFHNAGAFDIDGDSLSYDFVIPQSDNGVNVINYRDPNAQEFYGSSGLPFNQSNENGDGPPIFTIDPVTGDIVWDAPGTAGEYNIAFRIREWRKVGDKWIEIGYVTRDMQIIVFNCNNERPELIVPADTCVVAGSVLEAKILAQDRPTMAQPPGSGPDRYDPVKIEAFSQLFDITPSPATVDPAFVDVFQPTGPSLFAEFGFRWQTDCQHIREQPYLVTFKATDSPPNGPKLATFKSWSIRVVPPAPNLTNAERIVSGRSVRLTFDNYETEQCPNADHIEVWRRVDSFEFEPDICDTGMPDFAGYELIDRIEPDSDEYIDDNNGEGLDFGASYCYRLVAQFPLPKGGESVVSIEQCVEPIAAEAPIIIQVSVEDTDDSNGSIDIAWRPPFDIDQIAFPPPYSYRILRSEGFSGAVNQIEVGVMDRTGPLDVDEVFTFRDSGLDTRNIVYNYRIVFSSSGSEVETSSVASSVRLELFPGLRQIELDWEADVPWSLRSQDFPGHEVFSMEVNPAEDRPTSWRDSRFALAGTADVNVEGPRFLDETTVDETKEYCYFVVTKGVYGNDRIDEPLINRSQIACAFPNDSIAPCAPGLTIDLIRCRDFSDLESSDTFFFDNKPCDFGDYINTLSWAISDLECGEDINSYNIYYSPTSREEDFAFLRNVKATGNPLDSVIYLHDTDINGEPLTSFKGCYRVTAVDRSNNESVFSNTVCKDNCPNYVLPNVFTPNITLGSNDTFMAFSDAFTNGGEGGGIGDFDRRKCPRFVNAVQFVVFNRWGREVYSYSASAGDENSLLINWDGRNNTGRELASGVYYYQAEVTFDVLDLDKKNRTLKGWIQLIR